MNNQWHLTNTLALECAVLKYVAWGVLAAFFLVWTSACAANQPAPTSVGPAKIGDIVSTEASEQESLPPSAESAAAVDTPDEPAPNEPIPNEPTLDSPKLYKLTYQIDRAAVPLLYYRELTLNVRVNQIDAATVTADGAVIPHTYDASAGQLVFTTSAATVEITLEGVTDTDGLGDATKAALKDGKGFAWSHGMDDNVYVKAQVDVLEQYGWRGTLFLIGNVVEEERNEDWIADAPYLKEKLAMGWSIGNHTWDHNCDAATVNEQTVLDGYNHLRQIVDASPVPQYQIISFAAPCFLAEYQPIILAHRDSQTTAVQFNESGDRFPLVVDPGATENVTDPANADHILAVPFDYDEPIGRSLRIEYEDLALEMGTLDLMARLYNEQGLHLWHNTLAHGDMEEGAESHAGRLATVAAYVESTYGSAGSNQIWVAPSDQIYSYLLVRDRSTVTLTEVVAPGQ